MVCQIILYLLSSFLIWKTSVFNLLLYHYQITFEETSEYFSIFQATLQVCRNLLYVVMTLLGQQLVKSLSKLSQEVLFPCSSEDDNAKNFCPLYFSSQYCFSLYNRIHCQFPPVISIINRSYYGQDCWFWIIMEIRDVELVINW